MLSPGRSTNGAPPDVRGRLSRSAIAALDPDGMIEAIGAQPDHLRDALKRARNVQIPGPCPRGLVVCGMGGSAIGGDLAAAVLGPRARAQLRVVRDYELEGWLGQDTLVVCASYSGNTEETLACYEAAGAIGAPRVAVTTGGALRRAARADHVPVIPLPTGLQPRAAVCYMLVSVLHCAAGCGAGPDLSREAGIAAALLRALVRAWGPDGFPDSAAKRLASHLHGTLPVIYGAGLTVAAARRWKAQMNENAKVLAFAGELPEIDHNEICGWRQVASDVPLSAIFLQDVEQHPRVQRRIDLTAALAVRAGARVERVASPGISRFERLASLVLLGDLVSVYVAVLGGVDPTPVEAIEDFKRALA